jgi:hypothetical protein
VELVALRRVAPRSYVFSPLPARLTLLSDDLIDESVAQKGFPIGPRNRRQGRQKVEWEARVRIR